MSVNFYSENTKRPAFRFRVLSKWIKTIISLHAKNAGVINYIFCNDEDLFNINKKFLGHEYYTDIITFDYVEENIISGDIFVSTDRVAENSINFGVNLTDEFLRVISHGILHLLGFNDSTEEEKEKMRMEETKCILLYKEIENGFVKL